MFAPKMDFHKKTAWTLKAKAKKLHFFVSAIKVYVTIPTKVYHLSGSVTKNSICDPVLGSAIKDKERLLHAYFLFCKTSLICALQIFTDDKNATFYCILITNLLI